MKTIIKNWLRNMPGTYALAARTWRLLTNSPNERDFLERYASHATGVCFLQIGAYDGKTDDHLHSLIVRQGWSGILFEPVKHVFDRLVCNYAGVPGIHIENKAVANLCGTRMFYRLADNGDPAKSWYGQLGSFNKEVVLSHKWQIPDLETLLIEEPVQCITVEQAMKDHGFTKVDLLLVDTEGEDFNILKSIDLAKIAPSIIFYESAHLSAVDLGECRSMLRKAGYIVRKIQGLNDVAVKQNTARRYFGLLR